MQRGVRGKAGNRVGLQWDRRAYIKDLPSCWGKGGLRGGKVQKKLLSHEAAASSQENPCPVLLLLLVCLEISPIRSKSSGVPLPWFLPAFPRNRSTCLEYPHTARCRPGWELHRCFADWFLEELWTIEQWWGWAQVWPIT